jgi:hypothetical protein
MADKEENVERRKRRKAWLQGGGWAELHKELGDLRHPKLGEIIL